MRDARRRTLGLVEDLSDEELLGPRLEIVNPLLWEIGHVAWFQERWCLRHACGEPPIRADADALWDSIAIAHDARWELPLPSRAETLAYMAAVERRVLARLEQRPDDEELRYFALYATGHEDMHGEAFTCTRQTLACPAPTTIAGARPEARERAEGDVRVPGGTFLLGAARDGGFVLDNEKWEHPVEVAEFAIARAAVTQGELARFADEGGYARRELWSEAGWAWRERESADAPACWRRAADGSWSRRVFDRWGPIEPEHAAAQVAWFEAEAFCTWAGRRLATEAEWELAAAGAPDGSKRRYPWGDAPPTPENAHLDGRLGDTISVHALAAGDSARGCRQMIGNVWEWTASDFAPYPGFECDAYAEYSEPWFHARKVLRGGAWPTRARLIRNTWRNFHEPWRRDLWAGLRTCAP